MNDGGCPGRVRSRRVRVFALLVINAKRFKLFYSLFEYIIFSSIIVNSSLSNIYILIEYSVLFK